MINIMQMPSLVAKQPNFFTYF